MLARGSDSLRFFSRGFRAAVAAGTLASLVLATTAPAAPTAPDRAEYVERVEAICKAETLDHLSILRGAEGMARRGELTRVAPRVRRAASAFRTGVKRIASVPRPPADVARLTRWLSYAKTGDELLRQLARRLQRRERDPSQRIARAFLREAKRANATVVGFEFDYCRVTPRRYD